MLVFGKNYVQMTADFEKKAVICALLLRFRKKKATKEDVRSTLNQPVL